MVTTAMDLSRPQRILLVIDLHPILAQNPNPNPYITSIIAATGAFLSSLPPCTLTSFKAIFSSLSPILSASLSHRIFGKAPFSLSFDLPSRTLASLRESLGSLPTFSHPNSKSRISTLVQSLLQIDHDYAWESGISDSEGMRQSLTFPSNLVVFFSPFPRNLRSLSEFFDLEVGDDEKLLNWDVFAKKFTQAFVPVNERFTIRGIHLCWINVNFDTLSEKEENLGLVFLSKGIREIGWGCYSTDAIVLGSSLLPFGLIFPEIACKTGFRESNNSKVDNLELILEVTDVSGNPLECKICDLKVFDVMPPRDRSYWNSDIFRNKDSGTKRIHIRKVVRDIQVGKVMESQFYLFLVQGVSTKARKDGEEHSTNEFFADKVLELLCAEHGGFTAGKPAWQILIAFLYKRSFAALVSIVDDEGSSIEGLLMPFTVNYAVLCVAKNSPINLNQLLMIARNCSSKILTSAIGFDCGVKHDRRKKKKKVKGKLAGDISWGSFRELVFSQAEGCALAFELEEVYFVKELNKAKKLQFLKCWMRQIKELSEDHQLESNEVVAVPKVRESNGAESGSPIKFEPQLVSPSSAGQACPSRLVTEDGSAFSCMEDVEMFFSSIPQKIDHGLRSAQSDLGFLAERLVCLCIQAVSKKFVTNIEGESVPVQPEDACDVKIAAEVSCLLLQKPKELLLKYKGCKPATTTSDPKSAANGTEGKIREHELQILLRMEILLSKVGEGIEDNLKQKMVKDICSLLQNIEFDLEKDLFQGESLVHFAGRIIKSRYTHSLGDITEKIYNQMEFVSFCDGTETSESLPNSNDDESLKLGDNIEPAFRKSSTQNTHEVITNPLEADDTNNQQEKALRKAHEERLMRAQERRDRHRRFTSFTSWMPDLRRQWALKQTRQESQMHIKHGRRKRMKISDVVCETPMTKNKQLQQHSELRNAENAAASFGTNSSNRSLCIALFQNAEDHTDQSIL